MPLGHSQINYLQKQQDGVVFAESFENDSFISADGWTIQQGIPATSGNQCKDGIKSWDNSANSQSLPVAKKILPANSTFVSVWFYDDATDTTDSGPYFKIKTIKPYFMSVGVRNSVSTGFYSYGPEALATDQPTTVTTVARTTGWHQFVFQVFKFGAVTYYYITIDAVIVCAGNEFLIVDDKISEIYVNANTVGGTGSSFGYFDEILVSRDYLNLWSGGATSGLIQILNVPNTTIKFYDSTNTLLFTGQQQGNLVVIPIYLATVYYGKDFPIKGYFEISTQSSATTLLWRSPLITIYPGDSYYFVNFDFGTKCTDLQVKPGAILNRNVASGGTTEVNQTALKDQVMFRHGFLSGWNIRQSVDNWYEWAVSGNPFSFVQDDQKANMVGVISASVKGSNSQTVTIMPNLGANPTDGFTANRYYVIRNNANTKKQKVKLISKTVNTLTFDQFLNFDVNTLDYVYSESLYPFMELAEPMLNGLISLGGQSPPAYTWAQNMQEYNNG